MMTHPKELEFVQEVNLAAARATVWSALIDVAKVGKYHLAPLFRIELRVGGDIHYGTGEKILISGKIVECRECFLLAHTFRFGSETNPQFPEDGDTLVRFELLGEGASTILKLSHSGFKEENQTFANIVGGWPYILERLKMFIEQH